MNALKWLNRKAGSCGISRRKAYQRRILKCEQLERRELMFAGGLGFGAEMYGPIPSEKSELLGPATVQYAVASSVATLQTTGSISGMTFGSAALIPEGQEALDVSRERVTIGIAYNILVIRGTEFSDHISVRRGTGATNSLRDDTLIVDTDTRTANPLIEYRLYSELGITQIDAINIHGYAGDDRLENRTDLPSILRGGGGNDDLRGGDATDLIEAGEGNDSLYGGGGNDTLYGEEGMDGLFGGPGKDRLDGGSDADRFLLTTHFEDYEWHNPSLFSFGTSSGYRIADSILGKRSEDVTVTFRDGLQTTVTLNGERTTFSARQWTDNEVLVVDSALGVMAARTNNNVLLRRHNGAELTMIRVGNGVDSSGRGTSFLAYNSNDGTITFGNGTFRNGDASTRRTVYHEIGHNWDTESAIWSRFLGLSGWRVHLSADLILSNPLTANNPWIIQQYVNPPGYSISDDEKWLYRSSASFARSYGRENPYEDFATTVEAYFMEFSGERFSGVSIVRSKVDLVDSYFATLAS